MKIFFKYINSIPFRLTIKHKYMFGSATTSMPNNELNSAKSWDVLRRNHEHFSVSQNREDWIRASELQIKKDGQDNGMVKRAKDVVDIINKLGVTSVFSVGVGGAGLEYQIKKIKPDLEIICSEYSQVNVLALRKVFIEADSIIPFDMKKDDWSVAIEKVEPKKQLCLFYRVDTGFTNTELETIFQNMYMVGIENIIVILCGRLTLIRLFNIFFTRIKAKIKFDFRPSVFAGYLRTTQTFFNTWRRFYTHEELDCGGMKSYILRRK